MNKKFMALFFLSSQAFAYAAGENPTITPKLPAMKDSCYQVSSAEELYGIAARVNGTDGFKEDHSKVCMNFVADIVINKNVLNAEWELSGDTSSYILWNPMQNFQGTLHGNGHTISGLVAIQNGDHKQWGFIGYGSGITISNLHIKDSYIHEGESSVYHYCGGFIGEANGAVEFSESSFSGKIHSEAGFPTGGFVGRGAMKIKDSHVSGVIEGTDATGGFVGDNSFSIYIERSYNEASVSGNSTGGLVGSSAKQGRPVIIWESYNKGKLMSNAPGGLVGYVFDSEVLIYNSYNEGEFPNARKPGGLVGINLKRAEGSVLIYNSFDFGSKPSVEAESNDFEGLVGDKIGRSGVVENSFFVVEDSVCKEGASYNGERILQADVENGNLLKKLQSFKKDIHFYIDDHHIDGSVWTQNIGTDKHPVLKSSSLGIKAKKAASRLQVSIDGNRVMLTGARIGSSFAVFDISGRALQQGTVASATHSIVIPNAGFYVIYADGKTQIVDIQKQDK